MMGRRDGVVAWLVGVLVAAGCVFGQAAREGGLGDPPVSVAGPGDRGGDAAAPVMRVGPIEGLTSKWHAAPVERAWVPVGSVLRLRVDGARGSRVSWSGAEAVDAGAGRFEAVCPVDREGAMTVAAEVVGADGRRRVLSCAFFGVDYPAGKVVVLPSVEVVTGDEAPGADWTNAETMAAFFGRAVSRVRALGDGRFVVPAGREVESRAMVFPPGFAALTEWRLDGEAWLAGAPARMRFSSPGSYRLDVGPVGGERVGVDVEVYSARIRGDVGMIPDGSWVTLEAETDPPGYEEYVTWLTSTKHGAARPVTGEGGSFTFRFDGTFGAAAGGTLFRWIGVAADGAMLNVDAKGCVEFQGLVHCPLGAAELQVVPTGVLEVINIGATGQDGVAVVYGAQAGDAYARGTRSGFVPIDLSRPGALLSLGVLGRTGSTPTDFGVASLGRVANGLEAVADFASLGCTQVRVELRNSGVTVASYMAPAGAVALLGLERVVEVGQRQGVIGFRLLDAVAVSPVGGPTVTADEILMGPAGCSPRAGSAGPATPAVECAEIKAASVVGGKLVKTFAEVLP